MLSPMVPQARRVEAYSEIERFKQSSPLVVECALALARPGGAGKSDSVRSVRFGRNILLFLSINYRATHVLVDLGWVDFDFGVPPSCPATSEHRTGNPETWVQFPLFLP